MKANVISQVLYDMKHQPVIGVVTMIGTALSIFLIMIVVMMQLINVVPFAPESNRDRLLYGKYLHLKSIEGSGSTSDASAGMSYNIAKRLFDNLEDAEVVTYLQDAHRVDISTVGSFASHHYFRTVDHNFWRVFDYTIIAGRPFNEAEFEAGMKVAVISETVARETFKSLDEALGSDILIAQIPFKVVGIVEDVSPLAKASFAEVFYPFTVNGGQNTNWGNPNFGPFSCVILAKSPFSFDAIREEVKQRKQVYNKDLVAEELTLIDHGSPFPQEVISTVTGSNTDPDDESATQRYIIYAILLIVPAINLSSMTQSRLRRRIAEIGVRRAFGCTRPLIIRDILVENFIVTLAGGLLGLILCTIFGYLFADMIFTDVETASSINVSLGMLLNWQIFGTALLICFILNLLSSGIPAWRASRADVVAALNSRNI